MNNKKFRGHVRRKTCGQCRKRKITRGEETRQKSRRRIDSLSSTDLTGAETRFTPTDKSRRLRVLKIFTWEMTAHKLHTRCLLFSFYYFPKCCVLLREFMTWLGGARGKSIYLYEERRWVNFSENGFVLIVRWAHKTSRRVKKVHARFAIGHVVIKLQN
jgi:hypothetical protein